ncbi:cysteine-rich repeat secretory protein 55-like [Aristolochia californica]|uniref:cysteine-rich repeat secretory protein 55-like n=1 Tax=Aristolochia californica TaxID=171875 RepID=UPI0035E1507D
MVLFHYLLLISLLLPSFKGDDRLGEYCNKEKNVTGGQKPSIDHVLEELVAKTPMNGFAVSSYGIGQLKIYGLGQCRGDVSTDDCSTCISDAAKQLPQLCAEQSDARIWFDYCFLRYSPDNFAGKLDTGFGIFYWNVENATDPEAFEKTLGNLMDGVRAQAIQPKNRGLGKDKTKFTPSVTIYALIQCTRDLPALQCAQCSATAVSNYDNFCKYKKGCRVLYSSCYVRYEIYPFFFPLDSVQKVVGSSKKTIFYP